MAYQKTEWKNHVVEKPRTYTMSQNADGTVTLTPAPGYITQQGTPLDALHMNKIEDELVALEEVGNGLEEDVEDLDSRLSKSIANFPKDAIPESGKDKVTIENAKFIKKVYDTLHDVTENAVDESKIAYGSYLGIRGNGVYWQAIANYDTSGFLEIEEGVAYSTGANTRKIVYVKEKPENWVLGSDIFAENITGIAENVKKSNTLVIPDGTKYMIVSCAIGYLKADTILATYPEKKVLVGKVLDDEIDVPKALENEEKIAEIQKNSTLETPFICIKQRNEDFLKRYPFGWKSFGGKHYAVMAMDDGRYNLPVAGELFKSLGVPLNLALPSIRLGEVLSNGKTLKDYALELQSEGCEIFSHGHRYTGNITNDMTTDEIRTEIITAKKLLYESGFECRGFIKSGGANVPSTLQNYIGIVNEYHIYGSACANVSYPQYYNLRKYLQDGITSVKEEVDNLVSQDGGGYKWFYCHEVDGTETNVTSANVQEFVRYAKEKNVEFVTFGWLYDRFGTHN